MSRIRDKQQLRQLMQQTRKLPTMHEKNDQMPLKSPWPEYMGFSFPQSLVGQSHKMSGLFQPVRTFAPLRPNTAHTIYSRTKSMPSLRLPASISPTIWAIFSAVLYRLQTKLHKPPEAHPRHSPPTVAPLVSKTQSHIPRPAVAKWWLWRRPSPDRHPVQSRSCHRARDITSAGSRIGWRTCSILF